MPISMLNAMPCQLYRCFYTKPGSVIPLSLPRNLLYFKQFLKYFDTFRCGRQLGIFLPFNLQTLSEPVTA